MSNYVDKNIAHYQKMADVYNERYKNDNLAEPYADFLENLPGKKILEIGCGGGRDTKYFHEQKLDVTATDLTPRFLEIGKEQCPDVNFQLMDMRKLEFPDASFDGIWANLSFHHISKTENLSTLKEFKRVLKNGGLLYLGLMEGEGEEDKYSKFSQETRHFSYYTEEEITLLITSLDMRIKLLKVTPDPEGYRPDLRVFAVK